MGADVTLLDVLRGHAARTPGAPCVSFGEETISFAELDGWSDRIAAFLDEHGVGEGDRVAILSHNAPIFYALLFACAKISAIMMPLNWRLSAREIAAILADGEPSVVLASDELHHLLPGDDEPSVRLGRLDALPLPKPGTTRSIQTRRQ